MPAIRKRRLGLFVFGPLALLIAFASPAGAPPGDLDPSFDGDGRVTTDFDIYDQVEAVAIQSDQKIVVVGFAHLPLIPETEDFALARYNPDGSLDPTFGGDGKVTTDIGSYNTAHGVVIQADGKIVVAGTDLVDLRTYDFALARYNPDGSLDTTFDGDGIVTTDFGGLLDDVDVAYAVAIQTDGRIVAAGRGHAPLSVSEEFALARYNPDGSLDTTFDGDGKVTTDFGADVDQVHSVGIQGDGKIVAAGRASLLGAFDFALARYNPDGSLDTTFDLDGKVTTDFLGTGDGADGMVIQADQKIVAVGSTSLPLFPETEDFAVARYNPDGSLDPSFGVVGKVTTDFAGRDRAFGAAIQRNGKIVAAGCGTCIPHPRPASGPSDFALARYNQDGSLDTTFGGDGKVTADFFGGNDEALAVAIQGDGKIVAAGCGRCTLGGPADFALARHRADFEADLSIIKAGPSGRVPKGRNMTYTLTVTNNGPDPASVVTITDQLPSSVTFLSTMATQGSCGESNGTVFCTLGEVSSGTVVTIEIVVRPTMAGLITNMASVASATPDPDQSNNADSVDTSICRITSRKSSIPCG